jgi:isoquinoline 1-oxidoreductase subunit alpha
LLQEAQIATLTITKMVQRQLSVIRKSLTSDRNQIAKITTGWKPGGKSMARLTINGKVQDIDVDPNTPLLWVLREQVGLTGTKYGCGIAQCGACTVHIDSVAARSCSVPVSDAVGKQITTIEGLAQDGILHRVQKAWLDGDVPQCGYCQSGMIMAVAALLKDKPKPTDADIDDAITNICRCGTFQQVRAAIHAAAANA